MAFHRSHGMITCNHMLLGNTENVRLMAIMFLDASVSAKESSTLTPAPPAKRELLLQAEDLPLNCLHSCSKRLRFDLVSEAEMGEMKKGYTPQNIEKTIRWAVNNFLLSPVVVCSSRYVPRCRISGQGKVPTSWMCDLLILYPDVGNITDRDHAKPGHKCAQFVFCVNSTFIHVAVDSFSLTNFYCNALLINSYWSLIIIRVV